MINIIKKGKKWNILAKDVRNLCETILSQLNICVEFSIVLADDKFIKKYNKEFRNKDYPTNVLSFPTNEKPYIGDIILSFSTIEKEAIEQLKSFDNHFIHILLHGILHLIGYDHIEKKDRLKMEKLEINILSKINIPNPYIIP